MIKTLPIQEKLTYLPSHLVKELEDYLDFLLHKYRLINATNPPVSSDLFGISRGEIETKGDIISPLEVEWKVMK
jgi:hypothetical protein